MNLPLPTDETNKPLASPSAIRGEIAAKPPVADFLLALAPLHLPNYRKERAVGDDLCVRLAKLAGRDQDLMRRLYLKLSDLLGVIANTATDDAGKWRDIKLWAGQDGVNALVDEVTELGNASRDLGADEERAKAMHDVRGGALSALLGRLQLLDRLSMDEAHLKILFTLTRDHLKIMRSAVVGLDEPRRQADRTPKSHDVSLALEKWHEITIGPHWHERSLRLFIDCRHEGALTECCLESAAIDRIFYNLVNNASRHAVGDRLDMAIFPVPEAPGECLRFVLSNEVSEESAASLRALTQSAGANSVDKGVGRSMFKLFEPEVSSTGSGLGLTVVADFVVEAFGLRHRQDALRERYVGAVLDGRIFRVWFHWPVANNDLPPKLDDYHQPEQSLSEP